MRVLGGGLTQRAVAVSGENWGAFWSHKPKSNFWPRNVENWNEWRVFFFLFNFGECTGSMSDYKINIYKLGVLWPFTIYWHQNLHYGGGRDCSSDLTILKRMPKFRLLGKSFPKFPLGGVIAKLLVCSTVLSRWQTLLRKESSFINVGRELPRRSYNSIL